MSSLNSAKSVELPKRDNTEERLNSTAVDQLTECEIAYLAGLIDGEGSIMMRHATSRLGDQGARFRAQLVIAATTSMDLVTWLTAKLGNRWYGSTRSNPNHKQAWTFRPAARSADRIVERCLPYLVIKKRQAELYLRYRAIQRSLYQKGVHVRWNPQYVKSLRAIRAWFCEEFRKANARGSESVEANTLSMISEPEIMKIESELQGNLQRVSGDTAPPAGLIQ